jgi:hypothetical protein
MLALERILPDVQNQIEGTQKINGYVVTFAVTTFLTSFILLLLSKKLRKSVPEKKIKQIRNCVNLVVAVTDMIAEEVEVKEKIVAKSNDIKNKITDKMKIIKLTRREATTILDYNVDIFKEWWSSF